MIGIEVAQKDERAFEEFIEENRKLVISIIKRKFSYVLGTPEYDDYFQIGCIGLINAAKKYNPEFGTAFSTYAVPTIQGEIMRYNRDSSQTSIKISRACKEIYYKYLALHNEGLKIDDICAELGISHSKLNGIIDAMGSIRSMSDTVYQSKDGQELTLGDTIADEYDLEELVMKRFELEEKLAMLKEKLSKKDLQVLQLHLTGKSQIDIGKAVGVTQVQVGRIIRKIYNQCEKVNRVYDKDFRLKIKEEKTLDKITKEKAEELFSGRDFKSEAGRDYFINELAGKYRIPFNTLKGLLVRWGVLEKTTNTIVDASKISEQQKERPLTRLKPICWRSGKLDFEYKLESETLIIGQPDVNLLRVPKKDIRQFLLEIQELAKYAEA